jgi:ATP-dependent DNA helicase RecG
LSKELPTLRRPLTVLKGIGPKRAQLLAEKGVHTLIDLLLFLPTRYEDRSKVLDISKTTAGIPTLVKGTVISAGEERFFPSRRRLFRITIQDETARLELLWFNYRKAYLSSYAAKGKTLLAYGEIRLNRGKRQMIHPDLTIVDGVKEQLSLGFYPVYPTVKGISGQVLRSLIGQALEQCQEALVEILPKDIVRRLGLPGLGEALSHVHFPPNDSSIDLLDKRRTTGHLRLTFDHFFQVMLNIVFRKTSSEERTGPILTIPGDMEARLRNYFPFSLTQDQDRAIGEILKDLRSGRPMNRLLQGDVGCGKTVVAAVASCLAVLNDWQVAIMVPTQVLAQQHYAYFCSLNNRMGFRPVILTGMLNEAYRQARYQRIRNGEYNLIVGTHALIQEGLSFARLGLVVIDEQHRFGVRQRSLLDKKGKNPHLLVMTATPIPRTLAMTVFADLDISTIKEYPKGRHPVRTFLADASQKRKVFNTLHQRLSMGEQGIVICPVIEGSEEQDLKDVLKMHERLSKLFASRFNVELIHGRLSPDQKDRVMEGFREGRIDLVVGTSVVEVGVHAPGATVMVIEHPERFGLSQLHQLRGRVGRGSKEGLCVLMLSEGMSPDGISRAKVLAQTNDGFEIAERDLEMRGQGELMGTRQSGPGDLDLRAVFREPELLMAAKQEAERILKADPQLLRPENLRLKDLIIPQNITWQLSSLGRWPSRSFLQR